MLSSITPLGERGRHNRWGVTFGWYTAGAVLGGAMAGALFGAAGQGLFALVGSPTPSVQVPVVVGILTLALIADLGWVGKLPSLHRQVNEDWLDLYRNWVYGGGFGWQLGTGILTIVPTAAIYAVWAMALLTGSAAWGAALGAVFGLARALPLMAARAAADPARLRRLHRRMAELAPAMQRLVVSAVAVALAGSAAVLLGGG